MKKVEGIFARIKEQPGLTLSENQVSPKITDKAREMIRRSRRAKARTYIAARNKFWG